MGTRGKVNAKARKEGVVEGVTWDKPWPPDSQMPGSSLFQVNKLAEVKMVPGRDAGLPPPDDDSADTKNRELLADLEPTRLGLAIYAVSNLVWRASWALEVLAIRLEALGVKYA